MPLQKFIFVDKELFLLRHVENIAINFASVNCFQLPRWIYIHLIIDLYFLKWQQTHPFVDNYFMQI